MSHRPHRSASQWQRLIDHQARSGDTAAAFCREHDIGYASFMRWCTRFANGEASLSDSDASPGFIELTRDAIDVRAEHHGQESETIVTAPLLIELDLGEGLRLRISRSA